MARNTQKALNADGLHLSLSNAIRGIETGTVDPGQANAISKAASQIISLARLQLQYQAIGVTINHLMLSEGSK